MEDFFQEGPRLKNQYDDDAVLRGYLKRIFPPSIFKKVEPGLKTLGERVTADILNLGREAEANPPQHIPYDAWGRRIDVIKVSEAWNELGRISAMENLVGTAYERKDGEFSRIHQFAKVYLFGPSSAIFTCPLAMSDGAARAIELYGDSFLKNGAFKNLISTDPDKAWTSGQWMTEKTGGSDVSGTSTVAHLEGGTYKLYGTKWFTSATTSEMAMTLARIEGADKGGRGLSLFYVKLRDQNGNLNHIRIHRLKDKLGTHALPTAELSLGGTPALLVGEEGHGVKKISSLFNITRIWNSIIAVSFMRRGIVLARDYASKREVFGRLLQEQPLHVETLAGLQTEYEGAFHLTFKLAELLGKEEVGKASTEESSLLRLLTPIAKLFTAKQAISVISEILESFGGAGYVEDTEIPKLLRDCQVLSIWEGTTNVLSLDVLRAIEKENVMPSFFEDLEKRASQIKSAELLLLVKEIREAAKNIKGYLALNQTENNMQAGARRLSFAIAKTYTAMLLVEHAQWEITDSGAKRGSIAAKRWCSRTLAPLLNIDDTYLNDSFALFKG